MTIIVNNNTCSLPMSYMDEGTMCAVPDSGETMSHDNRNMSVDTRNMSENEPNMSVGTNTMCRDDRNMCTDGTPRAPQSSAQAQAEQARHGQEATRTEHRSQPEHTRSSSRTESSRTESSRAESTQGQAAHSESGHRTSSARASGGSSNTPRTESAVGNAHRGAPELDPVRPNPTPARAELEARTAARTAGESAVRAGMESLNGGGHGTIRRSDGDAAMTDRLSSIITALTDEGMLGSIQQELGQEAARHAETGANSRLGEARRNQETREVERRNAEEARRNQGGFDVLGLVTKVVGIAVAAVSVVSSVFTGPLGIVAAIGIVLATCGPLVSGFLADEGILPRDVAMGLSIGCAAVGAAMSLGAGIAGAVVGTTTTVVNSTVQTATRVAESVVAASQLTASTGSAAFGADAAHHDVELSAAQGRNESAMAAAQEEAQAFRSSTQMLRNIAQVVQEAIEARAESSNAAASLLRA